MEEVAMLVWTIAFAIVGIVIIWFGRRHQQRQLDEDAGYQARKARNETEAEHTRGLRRKIKRWFGV